MGSLRDIPKTYVECEEIMQGKEIKRICNNTQLIRYYYEQTKEVVYGLQYHKTIIVRYFYDGTIELDSGGWCYRQSYSTKYRMNIPARGAIYQENKVWYIGKNKRSFKDGMVYNPNTGEIL